MIYIRTDVNDVIATGHVMRCLSIADAARQLKEEVTFILADEQGKALIGQRGYETIVLHTPWDDMEQELEQLEQLIEKYEINKIMVDSYQVTEAYLKRLTSLTNTIYIDDVNAFPYPVDMVICYVNYWKKFYSDDSCQQNELLLGTKYVPLRSVFCNCEKKQISEKVEKLLLLSGGTDNFHILKDLLAGMEKEAYQRIDVICGAYYSEYHQLCETYAMYHNIRFHKAVSDIENYMKDADLAVSAGGTTLYELCAVGVPTISYSFADNQHDNVRQFQKDEVIDYAGDVRAGDISANVNRYLKMYHDNKELRQERSRKMQQLVDGKGAVRIAKRLLSM